MQDFFGQWTNPQTLFAAAIVLFTFTLLRRMRLRRAQAARSDKDPRQLAGTLAHDLSELQKKQEELTVRLHEAFREMNARLDTKLFVLDELLNRAEDRIGEWKRLAAEGTTNQRGQLPPVTAKPTDAPSGEHSTRDATAATDPLIIEPERPAATTRIPLEPESISERDHSNKRFATIYHLADQGLSPAEIGERTKHPVGEIELILKLRRRREQETNVIQRDSNEP
ncbi:MAG: hypothetical protein U1D30_20290 [Planctomycetota bacterium]